MARTALVTAQAMDAERTRLENVGVSRGVLPIVRRMRLDVLRTYKAGGNPTESIRSAMARLQRELLDGMVAADLQARLRTLSIQRKARGLRLSAYDDAVAVLERRLQLPGTDIARLRATYDAAAASATGEIGTVLEREVSAAVAEAVRQGLPTRAGADLVRRAFDSAGASAENPYVFETIYRTQLQTAYSAARWNQNEDPAIQEILWGYEYVAVMDDRTTDLCVELDGVRQPKDSAFWSRFTPPNHYGCRSQYIEIFTDQRIAEPTSVPSVTPFPGFANNPGEVFRSLVAA